MVQLVMEKKGKNIRKLESAHWEEQWAQTSSHVMDHTTEKEEKHKYMTELEMESDMIFYNYNMTK